MPIYRVTIFGKDYEAMADLVREFQIPVFRHTTSPVKEEEEYSYRVDAYVDNDQIEALKKGGYKVDRHEDVMRTGKARMQEVGKGNRYEQHGPK